MEIITAGSAYIDIDVLACAIAYTELHNLIGQKAKTVLFGNFNETIPSSVRKWNFQFDTIPPKNIKGFKLVDVSNPNFLPKFVDLNKIDEVWDHRHGFEEYWKNKIGKHNIEIVGSCATLIWEQFKKHKLQNKISKTSANLLYTAIFSNTLNLQSQITNERDIKAYEELKQYISLDKNWIEQYYNETEESIIKNPLSALENDKKIVEINEKKYSIGQLELWSAQKLIKKHNIEEISEKVLGRNLNLWFLNMPSINEGKNYLITSSKKMQKILKNCLNVDFDNNIGTLNKIMLRKEVMHKLQEKK